MKQTTEQEQLLEFAGGFKKGALIALHGGNEDEAIIMFVASKALGLVSGPSDAELGALAKIATHTWAAKPCSTCVSAMQSCVERDPQCLECATIMLNAVFAFAASLIVNPEP